MGQASSNNSRPDTGAAPADIIPTSSSLRTTFRNRSYRQRPDASNDESRNYDEQPRALSSGIQRLSQIFQPQNDILDTSDQEHVSGRRRSNLAGLRTRAVLEGMFRRDAGNRYRGRNDPHQTHDHTASSSNDDRDDPDVSFPRLPSIDLSSTFGYETVTSHAESDLDARLETSTRRSNLRLNASRADRSLRQFTSTLRRRHSPPPSLSSFRPRRNEDQADMLSRLLSAAAAATAATLMGDDHNALSEARSLTGAGIGGEDGSFDGFLRALQNGRIASALRQGGGEADGENVGHPVAPLNFFRMFRFGASAESNPPTPNDTTASRNSIESGDGRMVPIIIVGIRSINSSTAASSSNEDLPPFIDALQNFPSPIGAHDTLESDVHDSIDLMLRPPQNGTSFRHRRRASMGGLGMYRPRLGDYADDLRDRRSFDRRRQRPWSTASFSPRFEPRPPPATPASPSPELSRISSRDSTPSRSRPTSLIATNARDFASDPLHALDLHSPLSNLPNPPSRMSASSARPIRPAISSTDDDRRPVNRRSDSTQNQHYPRFASGHPRRNGVVEPDTLHPLTRSSESNDGRNGASDARSWIIYVLGGSYPENHPILTTPSLFTENPTYEDMMLLSAMLGPAKAPVATEEDVENAGGVYVIDFASRVQTPTEDSSLVAISVRNQSQRPLDAGQQCLVCLCDFEPSETARELAKCKHLFHKECIDQWLTTGRNSCPLCREQGVDEGKSNASSDPLLPNPEDTASPDVASIEVGGS